MYNKHRKKKRHKKKMTPNKQRNLVVRDMIVHCKANTEDGRFEERGGAKDMQKEFMEECE